MFEILTKNPGKTEGPDENSNKHSRIFMSWQEKTDLTCATCQVSLINNERQMSPASVGGGFHPP